MRGKSKLGRGYPRDSAVAPTKGAAVLFQTPISYHAMTREELYALVWAKPMTKLAASFGLSDVGLRKICVKHDIPTPPLGYWAKLAHGKKVNQPPLPKVASGRFEPVRLVEQAREATPDVVAAAMERAREHEREHPIVVPTQPLAPLHPLAAAADKALRKARPDGEGFLSLQGEGVPAIKIGPDSIERAIRILDTLAKAVLDRGWTLAAKTGWLITIEEENFAVHLSEGRDRRTHVPTKADLKRQAEHDELRQKYPTFYSERTVYRSWDYFPSGNLSLAITDPNVLSWYNDHTIGRWRDRKSKRLEDYLNDILAALPPAAAAVKLRRAQEEEKKRLEAEQRERQRRAAARAERAAKRRKFLFDKAKDLQELDRLRALASLWKARPPDSRDDFVAHLNTDLAKLVHELEGRFDGTLVQEIIDLVDRI